MDGTTHLHEEKDDFVSDPAMQPEYPGGMGLSPREIFLSSLRGWWLVALLIVVGGLAGLLVHSLRPVVYEADFTLLTGIDQTTVGVMTQYEEDVMMEAVGEVLYSPSTIQQVANAAQQKGITVDAASLRANSSIERQLSTWRVKVRSADPRSAEQLAGIWQDVGYAVLVEAYHHAILADALARYMDSLEGCLARAVTSEPSAGLCGFRGLEAVEAEMSRTGAQLAQERLASRALSSGLLLDKAEKGLLPAHQVEFQRNQLVLVGGLLGLIAGIWAAQTPLRDLFARRSPRA
jgi:hypothetical protein